MPDEVRVCGWCHQELTREHVASGQVWRAADGSTWCPTRGEWKRHGVAPKEGEPDPAPVPVRLPGTTAYSHMRFEPDKCPRPEKIKMTKSEADDEEKRMRGRGHHDIRAYLCNPGCGAFHIGKNRSALAARIRHNLRGANSDRAYQRKHKR